VELSWPMRLRIAAAVASGVILIGFLAWPLAAPPDPLGTVSLAAGTIDILAALTLAAVAFLVGLLAYFLAWPYGREIAVLAVPSGLAVWAGRGGTMADLIQARAPLSGQQQEQIIATLRERQDLFAVLRWEPLFWLAILAAGFAGVVVGQRIYSRTEPNDTKKETDSKSSIYLNGAIALVGSALIAQLCIGILARDVRYFDGGLGLVVAQPAVSQVVFAVLVSFGLAAFVVKKFLRAGYVWPTAASGILTFFAIIAYVRQDVLEYFVARWPAVFFPNVVISILPVQMVALGALGSIAGYWLAVRYNYWRKYG